MSLYLEIAIGAGNYLVDASLVLEIREGIGDGHLRWQGIAASIVDLRALLGADAAPRAGVIMMAQGDGAPAALIVDRVEGLAEIGDDEFRALPPIGPVGGMIDAAVLRPAGRRVLLRLRGERALANATALG